jgi:hypothetical protein
MTEMGQGPSSPLRETIVGNGSTPAVRSQTSDTVWHTVRMPAEYPSTSRHADRLRTDVANVETGLEVIIEQVARLTTRKELWGRAHGDAGRLGGQDRVGLILLLRQTRSRRSCRSVQWPESCVTAIDVSLPTAATKPSSAPPNHLRAAAQPARTFPPRHR